MEHDEFTCVLDLHLHPHNIKLGQLASAIELKTKELYAKDEFNRFKLAAEKGACPSRQHALSALRSLANLHQQTPDQMDAPIGEALSASIREKKTILQNDPANILNKYFFKNSPPIDFDDIERQWLIQEQAETTQSTSKLGETQKQTYLKVIGALAIALSESSTACRRKGTPFVGYANDGGDAGIVGHLTKKEFSTLGSSTLATYIRNGLKAVEED